MKKFKWISVNRRLPHYSESVLVYMDGINQVIAWRSHTDGKGEHWASEECDFNAWGKVAYWMELPDNPHKDNIE